MITKQDILYQYLFILNMLNIKILKTHHLFIYFFFLCMEKKYCDISSFVKLFLMSYNT